MTEPSPATSTHDEQHICMKAIGKLQDPITKEPYHFFVPAYQRGYRWGKTEVNALMDDLKMYFDDSEAQPDYCLQPIVVRRRQDGRYEVIDGQQRLTTLRILMRYADDRRDTPRGKKLYDIEYETRPDSSTFLNSLTITNTEDNAEAESNPDFHYMAQALRTIDDWVNTHDEADDPYLFLHRVLRHVKVIWYETPTDDPIDLFRKINIGKVPLTNAELVKGLLIANAEEATAKTDDDSAAKEAAAEEVASLSGEWDRIEHRLHDDELWYFLTNGAQNDYPTRMDLILDIWHRINNPSGAKNTAETNERNPYQVFQDLYSVSDDERPAKLRRMWTSCKEIFANLEFWYERRDLYHLIGYLVARQPGKDEHATDIRDLYAELSMCDKSEMLGKIHGKIRETLNKGDNACGDDPRSIAELSYDDPSERGLIHNVLLLFNLLTLNETTSSAVRFPFDLYKKDHWDLEHIHATASGPSSDEEIAKSRNNEDSDPAAVRRSFFEGVRDLLKDAEDNGPAVPAETADVQAGTGERASAIVQDFLDDGDFDEQTCRDFWDDNAARLTIDGQDDIDNMALLSRRINRGYHNASFSEKRRWIIDADRNTTFVPPCTKNVFLKYYTDKPENFDIWSIKDRKDYLTDSEYGIIKTIARYLNSDGDDSENDTDTNPQNAQPQDGKDQQ